jgi:two-component system, LytTR family, sensor kinase
MSFFFTPIRPLLRGWLISFLAFGLVALVLVGQFALAVSLSWSEALQMAARDWLPWAIITPLVFRFVARVPIERNRLKLALPLHIGCGIAMMALCILWADVVLPSHFTPSGSQGAPAEPPWFVRVVVFRLPVYLVIVSLAHALYFYRRYQERERRTLSLEASLAKARLEALRMQLQPHFLFNSLNAIAELVHVNPEAADDMLAALSDLLRLTLETSTEQELPLRREMEFVERYLAIERVRFGKRLQVTAEIPREVQDAMVPAFLLQPLVENAIRHGLEPKTRTGALVVSAKREGKDLHLSVSDNGAGLPKTEPLRKGIGLANIRERLRSLYDGAAKFELRDLGDADGLTVEITIPFHTLPSTTP